ncbi:unnamed protein product [Peronospora belbahrii]|uniref:Reverse transcriptase RNase H-like domain-containing protein n=1 Tax=Peronospora belbahrii TaxID=622444 RepID=A0ABN8CK53_9STRA|nr:unnamed protein product [Peronospora belbahrii]
MMPDTSKLFHVVCDASSFAIECALMHCDDEGRECVEKLLAIRYTLIQLRVYLLGEKMFSVYLDHASLRTAVNTPSVARWLSFFSEYNFVVFYKPGKNNIRADALCLRPSCDLRRDMGHQPGNADDEDDDMCLCCIKLGLNAMVSAPAVDLDSDR